VDALGGRPGVFSARYAGPGASDADNNALLLSELAGQPAGARRARFRCVIAYVRFADDPAPLFARGSWEGHVAPGQAGTGGFGYDALFVPEGMTITAAQMTAAGKNEVSHRATALAALLRLMR
jgi:XTP/dITP diphosphohydrolase